MIGRFEGQEMLRQSAIDARTPLLEACGWYGRPLPVMVTDLQTGEGVLLRLGGSAHSDLRKHAIWVCPLFEPFLEWLYREYNEVKSSLVGPTFWDAWFAALPAVVELDVPLQMQGYRRPGPEAKA